MNEEYIPLGILAACPSDRPDITGRKKQLLTSQPGPKPYQDQAHCLELLSSWKELRFNFLIFF